MHLSDNQLLELNALSMHHLSQCKECQLRADNILQINNKLNQLPSKDLANDSWEKLKYTYQARKDEIKHTRNIKRIKIWKFSTAALAASLILAIVIPKISVIDNELSHQDKELALLVEQNNLLQQQLVLLKPELVSQPVNANVFRYQLSLLDQSIYRAQVQKTSIKEKSELWRNRQELLKHWLTKKSTSNTISI